MVVTILYFIVYWIHILLNKESLKILLKIRKYFEHFLPEILFPITSSDHLFIYIHTHKYLWYTSTYSLKSSNNNDDNNNICIYIYRSNDNM